MDEQEPRHRASILHSDARPRPHGDRHAVPRGRVDRLRRVPAARAAPRRARLGRVVVAGTTGESPTLTDDERLDLFRAAIEAVGEQATVVAGTGTYSTAHSVHLTERAHELGVDALLVVTPYYNKPPQRGIVAHFEAIARASDRPIVVYNIPARVVVNIEPETISRLAEIETVRAVKQANADLEQARHIVDDRPRPLRGRRQRSQPFLELGGTGGICVHTHVVGPQVAEQVQRDAGRRHRARRARSTGSSQPAYDLLGSQTNPIAIKAALDLLGHEVGGHRLPLVARRPRTRSRRSARASSASACSSRPRLPAEWPTTSYA